MKQITMAYGGPIPTQLHKWIVEQSDLDDLEKYRREIIEGSVTVGLTLKMTCAQDEIGRNVLPVQIRVMLNVRSNHESADVRNNGDAVEPKTVRMNTFRPPVIEDGFLMIDCKAPNRRRYKEKIMMVVLFPLEMVMDDFLEKGRLMVFKCSGLYTSAIWIEVGMDYNWSERVLEKPNEPPLSEGNTSRSGERRMEHNFELTAIIPITPHDSPLLGGYTPGSDEGRLKLQKLMTMCTKLSKQVIDLEKAKNVQAVKILRLNKRVKRLERQSKSSTLLGK
ncbi:hypothetical protein Tco_0646921 [Tanacetum coccineum]